MSNTQTQPTQDADIAAIRAKLMEDLATVDQVAKAVGKSSRTVARLIAAGKLPCVFLGRTPFVVISGARDLLMAAPKTRHAPVRRGRPKKSA
jgi:excisionase family DNA binding protein